MGHFNKLVQFLSLEKLYLLICKNLNFLLIHFYLTRRSVFYLMGNLGYMIKRMYSIKPKMNANKTSFFFFIYLFLLYGVSFI